MRKVDERVSVISRAKHADGYLEVITRTKLIPKGKYTDNAFLMPSYSQSIPSVTGGPSQL